MQQATPHTGIKQEEWILHIYCGKTSSDFLYYTDDGQTFDYQNGKSLKRLIQYHAHENKVVVSAEEGDYQTDFKTIKIVLHGSHADEVAFNGVKQKLAHQVHSFFSPLEKYDPINDPDSMGEENVKITTTTYSQSQIEITW
jgi:alpha-glucosidase